MVRLGDADEEARAYLQSRLTALWKVMFWAFVILIATQWVMYEVIWPSSRPAQQDVIYVVATTSLALMALIWRGLLVRRVFTVSQLYGFDLFYATGCGTVLGVVAILARDFQPAHYVCLIYGVFVVFTRAIIMPSSGRWTALTSIGTMVPLVAAALVLALVTDVLAPGSMFVSAAIMLAVVTALLAVTGSRLIYGLRRQVTVAMQLGQYTLDRKIGEGGMGAVYRAHHLMLRRPTAVKLLLPDRVGADNLARFEREVQAMSELTHPNTVVVFDYGRRYDGVFYYAMEYLGGGIDLERLVRTHGPQPSGRVADILMQVCGALHEAHSKKLIHRDIKPANIILCERGGMPDIAKVVDFGLVKEITTDSGASTQVILGTPAYVAPETVTDPDTMDHRADLYALGAVGYFLLTGRKVFEGKTAVDICIQHVTAMPRRPTEVASIYVAPELEAIIMRCLAKRPADRFASADDMAAALRALGHSRDWSTEDARVWWNEFRVAEDTAASASALPTQTMPVDLGTRLQADVRNA